MKDYILELAKKSFIYYYSKGLITGAEMDCFLLASAILKENDIDPYSLVKEDGNGETSL
jgi:hypothetical protein